MNIESFETGLFIHLHIKWWAVRNPPYHKVWFIKVISKQYLSKGGPHYTIHIITSVFFGPERVGVFFVPRGWVIFFSPERLGDFFLSWEVGWFFLSREAGWFFFVPRGSRVPKFPSFQVPKFLCSFVPLFLCSFVPLFLFPERFCDFFLSQEVRWFFLSREVGWFFLSWEVGWFFFFPRGWVIFFCP